jgi:hypothetical protein
MGLETSTTKEVIDNTNLLLTEEQREEFLNRAKGIDVDERVKTVLGPTEKIDFEEKK